MLGYLYGVPTDENEPSSSLKVLSKNQDLGVKIATPCGTVIGQLLFGWLADVVGRKRMYGIELMIMIVATFGQAVAGHGHGISIIGVLVVWRTLMGIGIGGDYPLSAVISSEFASTRTRGRLMTAVGACQGWGNLAAAIMAYIIVAAYKESLLHDNAADPAAVDTMWRLLIGLGCVPAVLALYFRLTIPETPRFTMDIERDINQATADINAFLTSGTYAVDSDAPVQRAQAPKASRRDFMAHFSKWENLKVLVGTAYSWFAIDISFYGLGLNSSIILSDIGFGSGNSKTGVERIHTSLRNVCIGNIILAVAGAIPGSWVTFCFIDSWGRKPIQLTGFIMSTILFIIIGFGYDALTPVPGAFVFLYCLATFFQNFGPNMTVWIVPGEVFPTRYRSTGHGISAACGKLGAVVAQAGFAQLKDIGGPPNEGHFVKHIIQIFAFFMLTGVFSTLLIPETKGKSLEELSNEKQEGFIQDTAMSSSGRKTPIPSP